MDYKCTNEHKEITIESVVKMLDLMKDEYELIEIEDLSAGVICERGFGEESMKILDDRKFLITLRSNIDQENLFKKLKETKCKSIEEYMNKWMKNEIK